MKKPYKATSIKSAERQVRKLRKQRDELMSMLKDAVVDCKILARLSADKPRFDNPVAVVNAKKIRDYHLEHGGVRLTGPTSIDG